MTGLDLKQNDSETIVGKKSFKQKLKDFGFGKGYQPYENKDHQPDNLHQRKYWNPDPK